MALFKLCCPELEFSRSSRRSKKLEPPISLSSRSFALPISKSSRRSTKLEPPISLRLRSLALPFQKAPGGPKTWNRPLFRSRTPTTTTTTTKQQHRRHCHTQSSGPATAPTTLSYTVKRPGPLAARPASGPARICLSSQSMRYPPVLPPLALDHGDRHVFCAPCWHSPLDANEGAFHVLEVRKLRVAFQKQSQAAQQVGTVPCLDQVSRSCCVDKNDAVG